MARVIFAQRLAQYGAPAQVEADGSNAREVVHTALQVYPTLRPYLLDDQGGLRKHVAIFIDGVLLRDRATMREEVAAGSELYVVQALSGG
jgi:hypothetical protein